MKLSVVLATRNNASELGVFLESLSRCRAPGDWEVIVVDNGSTDATRQTVESFGAVLPLRYCRQPAPGKSISLNHGLRRAQGEIVLFTDDDVEPDPDWLLNHVRAMDAHPGTCMVGGRITVDHDALPAWLGASFNLRGMLVTEHDLGDAPRPYAAGEHPFGPNMSVRRRCLEGIEQPWPEHLGPGTALPLGDELLFSRKIAARTGENMLYEPSCAVRHRAAPEKIRFLPALRRCFLGGYVAGRYAGPATEHRDGAAPAALRLARDRLGRSRSLPELLCMSTRAGGYAWGRLRSRD